MPYDEDDLLPLSALQHLEFCERQCALIHIEGIWDENRLTAEGRHLHERVHALELEVRVDVRVSRGLRLRSLDLGLSGKADVVEFHRIDASAATEKPADGETRSTGMNISGVRGLWKPLPVEYKRGRPKRDASDEVQLCAQALCLEEMTGVVIPEGALFYWSKRKRFAVVFDKALREKTRRLCLRLHKLLSSETSPAAEYGGKCERCSLLDRCLPKVSGGRSRVQRYIRSSICALLEDMDGS